MSRAVYTPLSTPGMPVISPFPDCSTMLPDEETDNGRTCYLLEDPSTGQFYLTNSLSYIMQGSAASHSTVGGPCGPGAQQLAVSRPVNQSGESQQMAVSRPVDRFGESQQLAVSRHVNQSGESQQLAVSRPVNQSSELQQLVVSRPVDRLGESQQLAVSRPVDRLGRSQQLAVSRPVDRLGESQQMAVSRPVDWSAESQHVPVSRNVGLLSKSQQIAVTMPQNGSDEPQQIPVSRHVNLSESQQIPVSRHLDLLSESQQIAVAMPPNGSVESQRSGSVMYPPSIQQVQGYNTDKSSSPQTINKNQVTATNLTNPLSNNLTSPQGILRYLSGGCREDESMEVTEDNYDNEQFSTATEFTSTSLESQVCDNITNLSDLIQAEVLNDDVDHLYTNLKELGLVASPTKQPSQTQTEIKTVTSSVVVNTSQTYENCSRVLSDNMCASSPVTDSDGLVIASPASSVLTTRDRTDSILSDSTQSDDPLYYPGQDITNPGSKNLVKQRQRKAAVQASPRNRNKKSSLSGQQTSCYNTQDSSYNTIIVQCDHDSNKVGKSTPLSNLFPHKQPVSSFASSDMPRIPANLIQVTFGSMTFYAFLMSDIPYCSIAELIQRKVLPVSALRLKHMADRFQVETQQMTISELNVLKAIRVLPKQTKNTQIFSCENLVTMARVLLNKGFNIEQLRTVASGDYSLKELKDGIIHPVSRRLVEILNKTKLLDKNTEDSLCSDSSSSHVETKQCPPKNFCMAQNVLSASNAVQKYSSLLKVEHPLPPGMFNLADSGPLRDYFKSLGINPSSCVTTLIRVTNKPRTCKCKHSSSAYSTVSLKPVEPERKSPDSTSAGCDLLQSAVHQVFGDQLSVVSSSLDQEPTLSSDSGPTDSLRKESEQISLSSENSVNRLNRPVPATVSCFESLDKHRAKDLPDNMSIFPTRLFPSSAKVVPKMKSATGIKRTVSNISDKETSHCSSLPRELDGVFSMPDKSVKPEEKVLVLKTEQCDGLTSLLGGYDTWEPVGSKQNATLLEIQTGQQREHIDDKLPVPLDTDSHNTGQPSKQVGSKHNVPLDTDCDHTGRPSIEADSKPHVPLNTNSQHTGHKKDAKHDIPCDTDLYHSRHPSEEERSQPLVPNSQQRDQTDPRDQTDSKPPVPLNTNSQQSGHKKEQIGKHDIPLHTDSHHTGHRSKQADSKPPVPLNTNSQHTGHKEEQIGKQDIPLHTDSHHTGHWSKQADSKPPVPLNTNSQHTGHKEEQIGKQDIPLDTDSHHSSHEKEPIDNKGDLPLYIDPCHTGHPRKQVISKLKAPLPASKDEIGHGGVKVNIFNNIPKNLQTRQSGYDIEFDGNHNAPLLTQSDQTEHGKEQGDSKFTGSIQIALHQSVHERELSCPSTYISGSELSASPTRQRTNDSKKRPVEPQSGKSAFPPPKLLQPSLHCSDELTDVPEADSSAVTSPTTSESLEDGLSVNLLTRATQQETNTNNSSTLHKCFKENQTISQPSKTTSKVSVDAPDNQIIVTDVEFDSDSLEDFASQGTAMLHDVSSVDQPPHCFMENLEGSDGEEDVTHPDIVSPLPSPSKCGERNDALSKLLLKMGTLQNIPNCSLHVLAEAAEVLHEEILNKSSSQKGSVLCENVEQDEIVTRVEEYWRPAIPQHIYVHNGKIQLELVLKKREGVCPSEKVLRFISRVFGHMIMRDVQQGRIPTTEVTDSTQRSSNNDSSCPYSSSGLNRGIKRCSHVRNIDRTEDQTIVNQTSDMYRAKEMHNELGTYTDIEVCSSKPTMCNDKGLCSQKNTMFNDKGVCSQKPTVCNDKVISAQKRAVCYNKVVTSQKTATCNNKVLPSQTPSVCNDNMVCPETPIMCNNKTCTYKTLRNILNSGNNMTEQRKNAAYVQNDSKKLERQIKSTNNHKSESPETNKPSLVYMRKRKLSVDRCKSNYESGQCGGSVAKLRRRSKESKKIDDAHFQAKNPPNIDSVLVEVNQRTVAQIIDLTPATTPEPNSTEKSRKHKGGKTKESGNVHTTGPLPVYKPRKDKLSATRRKLSTNSKSKVSFTKETASLLPKKLSAKCSNKTLKARRPKCRLNVSGVANSMCDLPNTDDMGGCGKRSVKRRRLSNSSWVSLDSDISIQKGKVAQLPTQINGQAVCQSRANTKKLSSQARPTKKAKRKTKPTK